MLYVRIMNGTVSFEDTASRFELVVFSFTDIIFMERFT